MKIWPILGATAVTSLLSIVSLVTYGFGIGKYQARFIPPEEIEEVGELIDWMGEPWFVLEVEFKEETYYEVMKPVSTRALMITMASRPPAYTIDSDGEFIGWTVDSGDGPQILPRDGVNRRSVEISEFYERFGIGAEPDGAGNEDHHGDF